MPLHDGNNPSWLLLNDLPPVPAVKTPKTRVRPARVHLPSRELHTTIVRGYGFRASASDGWSGPVRKTYADARKDARIHRLQHSVCSPDDVTPPTEGKAA